MVRANEGKAVPPSGKLRSVVTYLEMTQRPAGDAPEPPVPGAAVERVRRPSVGFYRHLYGSVGEDWLWGDRRRLTDGDLGAILADDAVEVYVLRVGGEIAGYVELDRRDGPDVEIAYLGIMPGFIGRGLGRYLLRWAIDRAFGYGTPRLWLHTCNFDHPRAVAFYVAGGFRPYRTVVEDVDDPRLCGLMPRTAAPHVPLADES